MHRTEVLKKLEELKRCSAILPEGAREAVAAAIELLKPQLSVVYDWPYNLVKEILDYDHYDPVKNKWHRISLDEPLTDDQMRGLDYALSTLSDKERKVLDLRYKDGLTLEQTGHEFGVTRERIRQVESKAIRKLRHPAKIKYIREGYMVASEAIKSRVFDAYQEEIQKREAEIKKVIDDLRTSQEKWMLVRDYANAVFKDEIEKEENSIDSLGLSVRSYNCLKRKGINTISELTKLSFRDLFRIRNLGRRSAEEIIEKLDKRMIPHNFHEERDAFYAKNKDQRHEGGIL